MSKTTHLVSTLVCAFSLVACSPSPPNEEKIKADLVGRDFAMQQSLFGGQMWRIEAGEIKGFRLVRRMTDSKAGTDIVLIAVNLEGVTSRASGDLKLTYRRYDQGWQLDTVEPASQFSFNRRGNETK